MRREDGFTAVEMVVTVLLVSIVSFMMLDFLDSTTMLSNRANGHSRAEQEAQQAMRMLTQDLRSANPITGAPCTGGYKDCVSFDVQRAAQYGRTCEKTVFTYRLASGTLTRSMEERTWSTATNACVVTRSTSAYPLLRSVVNNSTTPQTPLFTYYDNKGALLDPGTKAAVIPLKPSLGGAASVNVTFVVRYLAKAPDVRLSGSVSLRNNR